MEGRGVYGERLGLRHKWGSCGVQAEFAALGWGQVERGQGTSLGLLLVEVCSGVQTATGVGAGRAGVLATRYGRLTWGMVGETPRWRRSGRWEGSIG